jgi:tRNA-specific 2-thiouridylase
MRVLVAMSGGVDSSVAAVLLREQGYDLVGVTLRLYDCESGQSERSCCGLSGVAEARAAAGRLGMPHYVVDGQDLFERRVLRYAWDTYRTGRTPNPCVRCNEWMKFGLLYEQARKLGASYVATGHHARVLRDGAVGLARGKDPLKDQSYFLFSLTPEQLNMSLLPVGELDKSEVREIARERDLPNAARMESQDACIAQRSDLAQALRARFSGLAKPGRILDTTGTLLGRHDGVHRFTVGQRKGLGVALGHRAYVVSICSESGDVVVGSERELEARGLRAEQARWLVSPQMFADQPVEVQIRYRHRAVPARLVCKPDSVVEAWFDEPQRAVTPGQAAVFYCGDRLLGGGWIACAL